MKKVYTLFLLMLVTIFTTGLLAQVPDGFNYQAVARTGTSGQVITDADLSVRIAILSDIIGPTIVWEEEHQVHTNQFGLFTLTVGDPTATMVGGSAGSFSAIDWGSQQLYIRASVKETSGSWQVMAPSPLVAVPYSLISKNTETKQQLSLNADQLALTDGGSVSLTQYVNTDNQQIQITNDMLILTNGGSVDLSGYLDNTDSQQLSLSGDDLALTNGGAVSLAKYQSPLGINGDTLYKIDGSLSLGTSTPGGGKLAVVSTDDASTDPLFEVKRNDGQPVFAVYNSGVKVFVDDIGAKGPKGGFAIGGFDRAKGINQDYLIISPDSIRMFIKNTTAVKGPKGGFAIGGFDAFKAGNMEYFNVSGKNALDTYSNASQILWYPRKEAFLAGNIHIGSPDSVGTNSTAIGFRPIAMGDYSQAFGYESRALANNSTAIGNKALASGWDSYAFGSAAEATGDKSFALGSVGLDSLGNPMGVKTLASGPYSMAFGMSSQATMTGALSLGVNSISSGIYATAIGYRSISSAAYSNSFGLMANAYANYAMALGMYSKAGGVASLSLGYGSRATGDYSVAIGYYANTTGNYAAAIGYNANAAGYASAALGYFSSSGGSYSYALGRSANASASYAYAIGYGATASSSYATAIGLSSTASNSYSTAIGRSSIASGYASQAFGYYAKSQQNYANAIGYYADARNQFSFAVGTSAIASADYAFAMGRSAQASGITSTAIGYNAKAQGADAYAIGKNALASAASSVVLGSSTSSATSAISLGSGNTSSGLNSVTLGTSNTAGTSDNAIAIGNTNNSTGGNSLSFGNSNTSSGSYSTAIGTSTTSTGSYSTAMGYYASATSSYATAVGYKSSASGSKSLAVGANYYKSNIWIPIIPIIPIFPTTKGYVPEDPNELSNPNPGVASKGFIIIPSTINRDNTAVDNYSIAIGNGNSSSNGGASFGVYNNASAEYGTAIGFANTAAGRGSIAAGYGSQADGDFAIGMGRYAYAQATNSFAIGRYNVLLGSTTTWNETDPLFQVGNGSATDNTHDAMRILKNGGAYHWGTNAYYGLYVYNRLDENSTHTSGYGIRSIVGRYKTGGNYWSGYFYDLGTAGTYNGLYADLRTGDAIDVAEYIYDTNGDTEPADVVVADVNGTETVVKSSTPYQESVVGVVSTEPHLTMGMDIVMDEETGQPLEGVQATRLALTGRVPVNATDENGPIKPGDMLTTSSTQGYAMKWTLLDVSKAKDFDEMKQMMAENERRRNAIIGKALSSLESGSGKVVVLISL